VLLRPVSRRLAAVAAAAFVAFGVSMVAAPGAAAAYEVGYIRLAHLAPDCTMVDVYVSSQTGAVPTKIIPSVEYGRVSDYLALPVGPYAIALRDAGAPATEQPELATQVTVEAGRAYTVAALGKRADLGARVLNDDLTMPPAGKARVRIVQAAAQTPILTVSVGGGGDIADRVPYATSTDYREVDQGTFTVKVQQQDGLKTATINVSLASMSVYSLFVIDRETGLSADLRPDALRSGTVPEGGVETGAGGTRQADPVTPVAAAVILLAGLIVITTRLRARRT
jgi:Domain of unknown function (DUF4397)